MFIHIYVVVHSYKNCKEESITYMKFSIFKLVKYMCYNIEDILQEKNILHRQHFKIALLELIKIVFIVPNYSMLLKHLTLYILKSLRSGDKPFLFSKNMPKYKGYIFGL